MYNLNNAVSNELNNYELRGINAYLEKKLKQLVILIWKINPYSNKKSRSVLRSVIWSLAVKKIIE